MKRFLGFGFAMFFALVGIALVGGDSGAVAGHGCHGRCHGGLLARLHRCHGERERCHGLFGRHRGAGCHGGAVAEAAASDCGSCGEEAVMESGCGSCGGESAVSSDCGSCGGGEVVMSEGGCVGGACGGESVISEGVVEQAVPTEAAPVAAPTPAAPAAPAVPAAPEAPAAPKAT